MNDRRVRIGIAVVATTIVLAILSALGPLIAID